MEENSIIIKFPVKSFRKIPNPDLNSNNSGLRSPEMYQLIVDVKDIPDNFPMGTNPRNQNLDTKVAKKIKDSLLNHVDRNFYLLNRGILLSAAKIEFDNLKNIVTIVFEDLSVHGNVDGGHTYKVILENRDQLEQNEQFVKLEVLTGIEDMFEDFASSRNTSLPVKDVSIENLRGHFAMLEAIISGEPYATNINYKENGDKDIDIQDVLALLYMFNIDKYPLNASTFPIASYSAKRVCLDEYINNYKKYKESDQNPYKKMLPIVKDIVKLFDEIEVKIGDFYNGPGNKKYGRTVGVATAKSGKKFLSKYYKREMDYATPNGFLYPILGAFRALVAEKDGAYVWKKDPFETLNNIGPTLVNFTIEQSREKGNNPNATGKSSILWSQLYTQVILQTVNLG